MVTGAAEHAANDAIVQAMIDSFMLNYSKKAVTEESGIRLSYSINTYGYSSQISMKTPTKLFDLSLQDTGAMSRAMLLNLVLHDISIVVVYDGHLIARSHGNYTPGQAQESSRS